MIYVRIFGVDNKGRNVNEGKIVWDGKTVRPEPDTLLLQNLVKETIIAKGGQKKLTAKDGQAFLENLKYHYKSAYLRAGDPVQDTDKEKT